MDPNLVYFLVIESQKSKIDSGTMDTDSIKTLASLCMAVSPAFKILSKFSQLAEFYPAVFVYNGWKEILKSYKKRFRDTEEQLFLRLFSNYYKGCCNVFDLTLQPTEGDSLKFLSTKDESECYDYPDHGSIYIGNVNFDYCSMSYGPGTPVVHDITSFTIKGSYIRKWIFKSKKIKDFVVRGLEKISWSGLRVEESSNHLMAINEIVWKLKNNYSLVVQKSGRRIYRGDWLVDKDKLVKNLSRPAGEISRPSFKECFEELVKEDCEEGIFGTLVKKFDERTATVLEKYTKNFWKDNGLVKNSMKFLVKYNTSFCSKEITKGKNWQRKRYCNDISYLLYLCGYPRLSYFDKEIPPTKICKTYFDCCEKKERNVLVLKPQECTEEFLKIKKNQKAKTGYKMYLKAEVPLFKRFEGLVSQQKTETSDSDTKKLMSGEFKSTLEFQKEVTRREDFKKIVVKNKEIVNKKVTYLEVLNKNLRQNCKNIKVKNELLEKSKKMEISIGNCVEFASEVVKRGYEGEMGVSLKECLSEISEKNKINKSKEGWVKEKNPVNYKFECGNYSYSVNDNYFMPLMGSMVDQYTKVIKETESLNLGISSVEKDTINILISEIRKERAERNLKKRMEKEWIPNRNSKRGRSKSYLRKLNKRKERNNLINKSRKEEGCAIVNKSEEITKYYQQLRSIKMFKVKKSALEARIYKKCEVEGKEIDFLCCFPKIVFLGESKNDIRIASPGNFLKYHENSYKKSNPKSNFLKKEVGEGKFSNVMKKETKKERKLRKFLERNSMEDDYYDYG